ncbi:hypothetical protein SAMN05444396_103109 [Flavobacterium segetis]|uniref:Uncharacterized protein n=1 Tax=Flavobacterium segetis TaxID=271157 RepID=A0A1M5FXU2_9FLAO|nr:hypothetical protein [Flavobacterium segetis]SHF95992.1 hypothetical protein SAMN05444396_103109 [Flavobacterium segetis]
MKKQLEADLISIAHRVLQLKNRSDINQLYLETQKLYEKLAVLRFVDQHFSEVQPTIGRSEIEKQINVVFDTVEENLVPIEIVEKSSDEEILVDNSKDELIIVEEETNISNENPIPVETAAQEFETIKEEKPEIDDKENPELAQEEINVDDDLEPQEIEQVNFTPSFELTKTDVVEIEVETKKVEAVQISFEELLGGNYHDTLFVKKQQVENIPTTIVIETPKVENRIEEQNNEIIENQQSNDFDSKLVSLNDKLAKGINIDLNDRLAFIKHLFANSDEDYNRVLSQLITFNTFYETRDFIQDMVKPDYNNWEGKQEYEDRFMHIIEKKFL